MPKILRPEDFESLEDFLDAVEDPSYDADLDPQLDDAAVHSERDQSPASTEQGPRRTISVRLSDDDMQRLRRIADRLEIPYSVLARLYIRIGISRHLERIEESSGPFDRAAQEAAASAEGSRPYRSR